MSKTDALLKGIGSILDVSGSLVKVGRSTDGYNTDSYNLSRDWAKVGNDIRKADKENVRQ